MMRRAMTLGIAVALIPLMTRCGGAEPQETTSEKTVPVAVEIREAGTAHEPVFLTASGQVEAANSANLSTRMMGHVRELHVRVGQRVQKGQLLVSINNADLQAQKAQVEAGIVQATAAFSNAEKDHQRFTTLFEQGSASEKELEDMTTRYKMAKANLEAARQMQNEVTAQFAYAELRTPFAGTITQTFVKVGDMANPGRPLVSVEAPERLEVTARVPESEIAGVRNGMHVQVAVKSMQSVWTGQVREVSASARNTGGQYLVKIDLDSVDQSVLPGMFVNVNFLREDTARDSSSRSVWIPSSALVHRGQLTGIYAVSAENEALLRWLRLGKSSGDRVEVLSGLQAGERYVLSARGKLHHGAPISY